MPFIVEDPSHDSPEQQRVNSVLAQMTRVCKKRFWRMKRGIDFFLAVCGILVLAIPMAIIWLIIKLSAPSAHAVYSQDRVGRHGKIFRLYKFRTMVPNADQLRDSLSALNEMDGPVFKIKDDPRITKLGKFLRKTSLDELPQFFNVLKGDMAIIGPRPPLPREVEQYTDYQKLRLTVTPGLTCLWQVQPNRNALSFDEWVELDIDYILHRSTLLDIEIMIRTVLVMFRGEGC